jgi:hypothetical protein
MSKFLFGLVLGIALLLSAKYNVPVAETAAFCFLISVGHPNLRSSIPAHT